MEVEVDLDHSDSSSMRPTIPEVGGSRHQVEQRGVVLGRPRRVVKPPVRYGFEELAGYALASAETVVDVQEPVSYSNAIVSADSAQWCAAMEEEMQSLWKN